MKTWLCKLSVYCYLHIGFRVKVCVLTARTYRAKLKPTAIQFSAGCTEGCAVRAYASHVVAHRGHAVAALVAQTRQASAG